MRLIQRVRNSIAKRSGAVVTRADIAALGGSSQMTVVLKSLVDEGELIRLTDGIYAKAHRDAHGDPTPIADTEAIVGEIMNKLGIGPEDSKTERNGSSYTIMVSNPRIRVNRSLQIGSSRVDIQSRKRFKTFSVPENSAELPRTNVKAYVEKLARANDITGERTGLNRWADAVSRAAGDSVQLDRVGLLLSKLKQKHVISGTQMAHLMTNYLSEKKGVKLGV